MKKKIMIVIMIVSILTTTVYATGVYNIEKITSFDFANIILNGNLGLEKDKGYIRESDGKTLPSTINWDGTTYVPLRMLSELLGAEVGWDGSILIDLVSSSDTGTNQQSTSETNSKLDKINVSYNPEIIFDFRDAKTAFIETSEGVIVKNLEFDFSSYGGLTLKNAYMLGLEEDFTLYVVKGSQLIEQPFYLGDITFDSFVANRDQWYTVIPADDVAGFYHPMIIGYNKSTENAQNDFKKLESTLIVEGSNEGVTSSNKESYEKQIDVRLLSEISVRIANRNQFPYMISMFPRPIQEGLFYSHALDRDTLFNSKSYYDSLDRGNMYRLDQQFLAMIDYSQEKLKNLGLTVDNKVAIAGFSASSDWATRLTMIYPDRIKYVLANLPSTMPMTSYEGNNLPYPLGLSNIHTITGEAFDFEAYKAVPQFWFVGGADDGDGTRYDDGWGNYGDRNNQWNQEGIDYRAIFGQDSITRRETQMKIFSDIGMKNIKYISYPGLAHGWSDPQLDDIDDFIQKVSN